MIKLQVYIVPPSARHIGFQNMPSRGASPVDEDRQRSSLLQEVVGVNNSHIQHSMSELRQDTSTAGSMSRFVDLELLGMRKFLHITMRDVSIESLIEEIKLRSERMYPDLEELDVWKIQDSRGCDLDLGYHAWQVFDNNDQAIVLTHNELKSALLETSDATPGSQPQEYEASIPGLIKRRRKSNVRSFSVDPSGDEDEERSDNNKSRKPFPRINKANRLLNNGFKDSGPLEMSTPVGNAKTSSLNYSAKPRITSGMLAAVQQPDLTMEMEVDETPKGVSVASKEDITKKLLPDSLTQDNIEDNQGNGSEGESNEDDSLEKAEAPIEQNGKRKLSVQEDSLMAKRPQLKPVADEAPVPTISKQDVIDGTPLKPSRSEEPDTDFVEKQRQQEAELEKARAKVLEHEKVEEKKAREKAIEVEKLILKATKGVPDHPLRQFKIPTAGLEVEESGESGGENDDSESEDEPAFVSAKSTPEPSTIPPQVSETSVPINVDDEASSEGGDSASEDDSSDSDSGEEEEKNSSRRAPVAVSAPKTKKGKQLPIKVGESKSPLRKSSSFRESSIDPELLNSTPPASATSTAKLTVKPTAKPAPETPKPAPTPEPKKTTMVSLPSLEGLKKRGVPAVRDTATDSPLPLSQKTSSKSVSSKDSDSSESESGSDSGSDDDDSDTDSSDSDSDGDGTAKSNFIDAKTAKKALRKKKSKKNSGFLELMKDVSKA